jgi:hypothetical protein
MTRQNALLSSRTILGTKVYNPIGVRIGTVDELLIDTHSGRARFAMVWFDFEGLEDNALPLPWQALRYSQGIGGFRAFVTKLQLEAAPRFDEGAAHTHEWEAMLKAFYNVEGD